MKLSKAIEKLKWLGEQISPSPIKEAIDTVVSEVEKPTYTAEKPIIEILSDTIGVSVEKLKNTEIILMVVLVWRMLLKP